MALTKISNNSLSAISSLPSAIPVGALTLISTHTASDDASISITSNIDSTYDSYIFKFIDIHPETNDSDLSFQVDTGTNTNYNQTITSTFFQALHDEANTSTLLGYNTSFDQAQGTGFQVISHSLGTDNDQSSIGTLQLFQPSSNTFVKHFISRMNVYHASDTTNDMYTAGYINTTTPITRIQFKQSSGNFSGTIKMYGVS